MSRKDTKEVVQILREILKWIRFASTREVRTVLMDILDIGQKRLVYHLSDGRNSSVKIGNIAKVSDRTVRRYWESWARLGIVEPIRVRGGLRYKKSFELEDFGLTIPQIETLNYEEKRGR